jgi:hypothetical protein
MRGGNRSKLIIEEHTEVISSNYRLKEDTANNGTDLV